MRRLLLSTQYSHTQKNKPQYFVQPWHENWPLPSLLLPYLFFWGAIPLCLRTTVWCEMAMQSLFCTGSSLLCWLSLCCCYWHPWHFQVHFNSPIPISGDGGAAASPPVHPHRPLPNKTSQFCPSFTMGISQKNPVFTFLTHPSTQNPFSVEHREISVACVSHPLLYIFLRSATSVSDSSVWWLHTYFFDCSRWSTPFTSCDQMSWADARRGHQITKCRSFHCPILWRQRFFFLSFTAALWAHLSSN